MTIFNLTFIANTPGVGVTSNGSQTALHYRSTFSSQPTYVPWKVAHYRSARVCPKPRHVMKSESSTSTATKQKFSSLFSQEGDAVVKKADGSEISLIEFVSEQNLFGKAVLLGWLRHFGCTLCKKQVAEWRDWLPELNKRGDLTVAFIGNGPVSQVTEFVEEMEWPGYLFTDPARKSYNALEFKKKLGNLIHASALGAVIESFKKYPQTWTRLPTDPFQQGGAVLVDHNGIVTFFHADEFAGDHVDKDDLLDAVATATAP